MSSRSARRPPAPWSTVFDRRSLIELAGGFVVMTALFGVLTARVVDGSEDPARYTPTALRVGLAVGALFALGLSSLLVWTWRRGGGRPAQRAGLHAWQTGELPASPADREIVLHDLRRRARLFRQPRGASPTVFAALYSVVAALQIFIARDPLTVFAWGTIAAVFIGRAVLDVHRRRRLPQLQALIDRLEAPHTAAGADLT